MSDKNDDLADKIEEIRQMFLQRVRDEWLARIIALRAQSGDWSQPTINEMVFLTHTLAGSAATFGFKSLSDVARQIETTAKRIGTETGAKNDIVLALERLEAEARAALGDLRSEPP